MGYIVNGDAVTIMDGWERDPSVVQSVACSLHGTASAFCSWMTRRTWQRAMDSDIQVSSMAVTDGKVFGVLVW